MNKSIPLRTYVASALLCLTLFASCSADDDTALPEGKYPMTFATAMEGLTQTRATTDNTWKGDERIAMQVGSEVKQYIPTNSNPATLTGADADNTFYWQMADETKTVSAWYCGAGYQAMQPTSFSVQTDQSGNGYAKSDFLYATPQSIAYSDRDKELTFNHLPAKVVINLTNGNGLTTADVEGTTVCIVNQETTSSTISATTGTVTQITTSGKNEIITNNVPDAPPADYQKSVQAIVVPQKVAIGTKFIKVTIGKNDDARDYYYTTETDTDVNLECGKEYTYNIRVTKGEELVVTDKTTFAWEEGAATSGPVAEANSFYVTCPSNNVSDLTISPSTNKGGDKYEVDADSVTISYKTSMERHRYYLIQGIANVSTTKDATGTISHIVSNIRGDLVFSFGKCPEVGDYYYADGSWSSDYKSGSGSPACIGIVFKVDAGEGDIARNYGYKLADIRGYVVALQDANANSGAWGIRETNVSGIIDEKNYVNKYDGYRNTAVVRQLSEYKNTHVNNPTANGQYWAFKVASEYNVIAPNNTSGWYLPSIGQLNDIYYLPSRSTLIQTAGGSDFKAGDDRYWSSTEKDNADAWYYRFNGNGHDAFAKSNDGDWLLTPSYVRAILTF